MADQPREQIASVMHETRVFPPSAEFSARARIGSPAAYETLWNKAKDDLEGFWAEHARELHWFKPFDKTLEWDEPFARWFVGGKGITRNCSRKSRKMASRGCGPMGKSAR